MVRYKELASKGNVRIYEYETCRCEACDQVKHGVISYDSLDDTVQICPDCMDELAKQYKPQQNRGS